MTATLGEVSWSGALRALEVETGRLTGLLRSVRRPSAPCLGQWDLTDTAVHVGNAWAALPPLSAGDFDAVRAAIPGVIAEDALTMINGPEDLPPLTVRAVQASPERRLDAIAATIDRNAADYLAACRIRPEQDRRGWLAPGVEFAQPTFTCHLLNETIAHAYDIARADGRDWRVEAAHARYVVEGFLLPILALGANDDGPCTGRLELRVRGGSRYLVEFTARGARITLAGGRIRADARLSVDAATMLLVTWNRLPLRRAVTSGGLLAWGRKPWLAPRLGALAPSV